VAGSVPSRGRNAKWLPDRADTSLYHAKQSGRKRVFAATVRETSASAGKNIDFSSGPA